MDRLADVDRDLRTDPLAAVYRDLHRGQVLAVPTRCRRLVVVMFAQAAPKNPDYSPAHLPDLVLARLQHRQRRDMQCR